MFWSTAVSGSYRHTSNVKFLSLRNILCHQTVINFQTFCVTNSLSWLMSLTSVFRQAQPLSGLYVTLNPSLANVYAFLFQHQEVHENIGLCVHQGIHVHLWYGEQSITSPLPTSPCHRYNWASSRENLSLGFLTRQDSNWPAQLQSVEARVLKFWI